MSRQSRLQHQGGDPVTTPEVGGHEAPGPERRVEAAIGLIARQREPIIARSAGGISYGEGASGGDEPAICASVTTDQLRWAA